VTLFPILASSTQFRGAPAIDAAAARTPT